MGGDISRIGPLGSSKFKFHALNILFSLFFFINAVAVLGGSDMRSTQS